MVAFTTIILIVLVATLVTFIIYVAVHSNIADIPEGDMSSDTSSDTSSSTQAPFGVYGTWHHSGATGHYGRDAPHESVLASIQETANEAEARNFQDLEVDNSSDPTISIGNPFLHSLIACSASHSACSTCGSSCSRCGSLSRTSSASTMASSEVSFRMGSLRPPGTSIAVRRIQSRRLVQSDTQLDCELIRIHQDEDNDGDDDSTQGVVGHAGVAFAPDGFDAANYLAIRKATAARQMQRPKVQKSFSFDAIREALFKKQRDAQGYRPVPPEFTYFFQDQRPKMQRVKSGLPLARDTYIQHRSRYFKMIGCPRDSAVRTRLTAPRHPVMIFEVQKQHRDIVKNVLGDWTGRSIPEPYFLVLADATFACDDLSEDQLLDAGIVDVCTGELKFLPRFSGALLTVLSFDRYAQNGLISRDKQTEVIFDKEKYKAPTDCRRQMFAGVSILIPENSSPWMELDVLATHDPPLVNCITGPLYANEVSRTGRCRVPKPLSWELSGVLVREAQISAARHARKPTFAKLDKRERHHLYNYWSLVLEDVCQASSLRQDGATDFLQNFHNVFERRCTEGGHVTLCKSVHDFVQDSFEAEVQNMLNGFQCRLDNRHKHATPRDKTRCAGVVGILAVDKCKRQPYETPKALRKTRSRDTY